ncbi:MAG: tetratricopeptide repeat protein [Flavobacteriales bacterium]
MRRISPYLIITILFSIGCSGSKDVLLSEGQYSESLQRNYFDATTHLLKGDPEAAYTSFSRCSEEQPENSVFHYELGRIDYGLGRFESALMHYNASIENDGLNDWYKYHRGLALIATKDFAGALKDFKFWVIERSGDLEALNECSAFFQKEGQAQYAYKLLNFYENTVAKNVDVRLGILDLIASSDQTLESVESFLKRSIEDFPNEPQFLYQKGALAAFIKDHNTAISIFETLMADYPFNSVTCLELAKSYTAVGRTDEAFELLLRVFNSDAGAVEKKIEILTKYSNLAQPNTEIMAKYKLLLQAALGTYPNDSNILHLAALNWMALGEFEKSANALKKVITTSPGSLNAHYDYLGVLFQLREWEEVISASNNAALIFPLEPLLYLYSGDAYIEMQQFEFAVKEFNKGRVLLIDPSQIGADIYSELGICYRELKLHDDSYNAFEQSLKNVESPYIMNTHAYFLALDNKRMLDAKKWSTLANASIPDNPHFMDTMALVLHLLGQDSEALIWIVKASTLVSSPNPVFIQREGEIRVSLGEVEKGERLLDIAKELRKE